MDLKKSGQFTLGDDEPAVADPSESLQSPAIRSIRRNQRILLFLLPLLIAALLAAGYLDLLKRVDTIHRTGSTEVKSLSNDLETRLNDLAAATTKAEETLSQRIVSLEKQVVQLQGQIRKTESTLAGIRKSSVTRGELKKALAAPGSSISALTKENQRLQKEIEALRESASKERSGLAQQLAEIEEQTSAGMETLSKETNAALSGHVKRQTLQIELFKEQKKNQVRLDAMEKRWGEKFLFLEQKVDDLGRSNAGASRPETIVESQIE